MFNAIAVFLKGQEAQGLVEYALIIGLIALVVIGSLTALGGGVDSLTNSYGPLVSAL